MEDYTTTGAVTLKLTIPQYLFIMSMLNADRCESICEPYLLDDDYGDDLVTEDEARDLLAPFITYPNSPATTDLWKYVRNEGVAQIRRVPSVHFTTVTED